MNSVNGDVDRCVNLLIDDEVSCLVMNLAKCRELETKNENEAEDDEVEARFLVDP